MSVFRTDAVVRTTGLGPIRRVFGQAEPYVAQQTSIVFMRLSLFGTICSSSIGQLRRMRQM